MQISDDQLKELVPGLIIDDYPGYGAYGEVLWDNVEGVADLSDDDYDALVERLAEFVRTARVTVSWANEVE